jgi:hypothetical protein
VILREQKLPLRGDVAFGGSVVLVGLVACYAGSQRGHPRCTTTQPILGPSHQPTGGKGNSGFPSFSLLLSLFPFRSLADLKRSRLSSMSLVEQAKKKAAHAAVDDYISKHLQNVDEEAPLVVGIGSGSTIVYAVERLIEIVGEAKKAHGGKARQVVCIPTSFQATQLIQDAPHGLLHLGDLAR